MICGDMGSGKTLFMVIMAFLSHRKLISNFNLKIPNKKITPFEIDMIYDESIHNAEIFIDELPQYADSRTSQSIWNIAVGNLLFQSRKKDVNIFTTCQLFSSIDVRIRKRCRFVIFCEKTNNYFVYKICDKKTMSCRILKINRKKAVKFFTMYNTNQVIATKKTKSAAFTLLSDEKINDILKNNIGGLKDFIQSTKDKKPSRELTEYYLIENKIPYSMELVKRLTLSSKFA